MQITAPLSRVVGPLAGRIPALLVLIPEGPELGIAKGACDFIRTTDCDHYTMPVPSLVSSAGSVSVSVSPGSGSAGVGVARVVKWSQLARVGALPSPA
jgi:hypothetical protein